VDVPGDSRATAPRWIVCSVSSVTNVLPVAVWWPVAALAVSPASCCCVVFVMVRDPIYYPG